MSIPRFTEILKIRIILCFFPAHIVSPSLQRRFCFSQAAVSLPALSHLEERHLQAAAVHCVTDTPPPEPFSPAEEQPSGGCVGLR